MAPEVWTKGGNVTTPPSDREMRTMQQRTALSLAEPAPFGLFAFSVGTIVLAVVVSGLEPLTAASAVIPALLFVAGIGQFIAGLYGFGKSDTFAATAFCIYGATNVMVGSFYWMRDGGLILGTAPEMLLLGMGLFVAAYASLALTIAALGKNLAFVGIAASLVLGYALAAVTDVGGAAAVGHIGGYFLFLASLFALYAATGILVNSTWERPAIPLFAMRKAKQ